MSKVSVIIPTYNRQKTLHRAISSVLNQTYPIHELIICDDGSTDDSKLLVEQFKDQRIKWLDCGRNGMPSIPRNKGIHLASGEWIAFLDSDDEWLPNKIKIQLNTLSTTKLLAVSSNAFRFVNGINAGAYLTYNKSIITFNDLIHTNFNICSSVLINKDLLSKVSYFPEEKKYKAIEDYALWLRIAINSPFAYVPEPLLNYTDDPQASIRTEFGNDRTNRKIIFDGLEQWLFQNQINITPAIRKQLSKNNKGLFEDSQKNLWKRLSNKIFSKPVELKTTNVNPAKNIDCQAFEVDKWNLSDFILKVLIPIVGVRPYPLDELLFMSGTVCRIKPTHIFEWGTHIGKSARIFYETCTYFGIHSEIHSFDLPEEIDHAEHPHEQRGMLVKDIKAVKLYQADGLKNGIEFFNNSTVENKIPLFYLDGDHAYESVFTEITTILNNIPDANILLHDTFYQSAESGYNIGPYQAIVNSLSTMEKQYRVLHVHTGLPGISLIYKKP